MVNVKGLVKRSNYDDIVAEVEQARFKDAVKLPDRTAKFILEGPSLQNLEDTEAIEEYERRKRRAAAKAAAAAAAAATPPPKPPAPASTVT